MDGYPTYSEDYSSDSCGLPGNSNEADHFASFRQRRKEIFPYLALLPVEIARFTPRRGGARLCSSNLPSFLNDLGKAGSRITGIHYPSELGLSSPPPKAERQPPWSALVLKLSWLIYQLLDFFLEELKISQYF